VQIQARGPVHEAFAQPIGEQPEPGPVAPQQPPPPVPEQPPAERPSGDNVEWLPGYWSWDGAQNQFVWVSGTWRQAPPGRRFVPGYWNFDGDNWRWVNGFWAPAGQQDLSYYPQPPAPRENGPLLPAFNDNSVFSPGYWSWQQGQWIWVPGQYIPALPQMVWVPGHYAWTPCGFVWVSGYWDYPPGDRGLLFAPVVFAQPVWNDPGYVYCPRYALAWDLVNDALFVGPGCSHYFFGDYYSSAFARRGFWPWFHNRYRFRDPLYNYYHYRHGFNPAWTARLQARYTNRMLGRAARPALVLNNQNFAVRPVGNAVVNPKLRVNGPMQLVSLKGQAVAAPALVPVSANQLHASLQQAGRLQQAGLARRQAEKQTAAGLGGPVPKTAPVSLPMQKLNLPQIAATKIPQNILPALAGPKGPGLHNIPFASKAPSSVQALAKTLNLGAPGTAFKAPAGALPKHPGPAFQPSFTGPKGNVAHAPPTGIAPAFSASKMNTAPTFAAPKMNYHAPAYGAKSAASSPIKPAPFRPQAAVAHTVPRTNPAVHAPRPQVYHAAPRYSAPTVARSQHYAPRAAAPVHHASSVGHGGGHGGGHGRH
jgi:hypothetical protein